VNARQNTYPDTDPQRIIPASGAAYVDAIRRALAAGRKVVDYGSKHHQGLGHAAPADGLFIPAPTGVIDHYVPDFTVRAAAGTTLFDLQKSLAPPGQFLPLDGADTMTVAELITHNVYGPLRLFGGTTRDLLLGLRFVDGLGEQLTVGGRTVKNVAGYDVTRLLVGSLNTLGLITEATLRTAAIPKQVTRVELRGLDPAPFASRITDMLVTDAAPSYLDWSVRPVGGGFDSVLHVGYLGSPEECDAHYLGLIAWLAAQSFGTEVKRDDVALTRDTADRAGRAAWRAGAPAVVKILVPPKAAGGALEQVVEFTRSAPDTRTDLLPVHGIIHVGGDWPVEAAQQIDAKVRSLIEPLGGMRVWVRRPANTTAIEPFAPAQPDWAMLRRVKKTLDPQDAFNPGRLWK
jgi:glycolate oxidase FAD binding subunit